MVTKRKISKKAAPRRRRAYAAPRRRAKSGTTAIPGAVATVALAAVNTKNITSLAHAITNNGQAKPAEMITRAIPGNNSWVLGQYKDFITKDQLITDAAAVAGGYIAGWAIKKYMPSVIKTPLGKIAKKIPKVI